MRAARLLHLLLLLQNRGRMTATALAGELEVTPRTILRDIDALTEAGLPVIAYQGNRGGFELGFNYRTRLTGLAADEAEALGVWLSDLPPALGALGLGEAAEHAARKLVESFPDGVRERIRLARERFRLEARPALPGDPRLAALAGAVRGRQVVRLRAYSRAPEQIEPVALIYGANGWAVVDRAAPDAPIPLEHWGDINISANRFDEG